MVAIVVPVDGGSLVLGLTMGLLHIEGPGTTIEMASFFLASAA